MNAKDDMTELSAPGPAPGPAPAPAPEPAPESEPSPEPAPESEAEPGEARRVALQWLDAVLHKRRTLETARPGGFAALEPRDKAFVRRIVMTALRRRGQLDDLLSQFMKRPLPKGAHTVDALLRLGAAQTAFAGAPAHAAVFTSAALAKTIGQGGHTGFVNAVLRRVAREAETMIAAQDAAKLNTPAWLWKSWCAAYGEKTARGAAEAHLAEAPLDVHVREDAHGWAGRMGGAALNDYIVRIAKPGPVESLPGYGEGAWWVQDAAAALPARLLGDVNGLRVLDMCAAPGGKTAQLAAAGAQVTALDRSEARLKRLHENMDRLGFSVTVRAADALSYSADEPYDAALVDAPCSATGAVRRHPDLLWLKTPQDVETLAALQARLLARAAELVKPGGLIVFATCSLQTEEGAGAVDAAIAAAAAAGAPLTREPLAPEHPGLDPAWITAEGDLRTFPFHMAEAGGMDGFFAARLRRA